MNQSEPVLTLNLDDLRRKLRSRNRGVGYRAADQLASLGDVGRTILQRALDSRDRHVRLHAAWAARLLGDSSVIARLIELLRDDQELYLPLQQALAAHQDATLIGPLRRAALDLRNRNRKFHLMLLGDLHDPEALDALLQALQSEDQCLQEGAFYAFKHAAPALRQQARKALVQALTVRLPLPSRVPWLWTARARARFTVPLTLIAAVGLVSDDEGVGALCEILRSRCHASYRLGAISALVTVGEVAVGRCAQALSHLVSLAGDSELQAAAAEALRRLRATAVEEEMLALLGSPHAYHRRNAADALEGCAVRPSTFQHLAQLAAEDGDVHVRRTCVLALASSPFGACDEALVRFLEDRDRWVGWNAAWVLGRRKLSQVVVDGLRVGLHSDKSLLRRNCAEALGQLRCKDPEVLESLVATLADRLRKCVKAPLGRSARSTWARRSNMPRYCTIAATRPSGLSA